jgi:rubrerythrin
VSILSTQARLSRLNDRRRALESELSKVSERIAEAEADHREQIAKSLQSSNREERDGASRIARWWGVAA